ncbi:MAG: response regulator [bacterium]|nr:response regulator [bacterium]
MKPQQPKAPKVMLIDDDALFIDLLEHRLSHEGMTYVYAPNAEMALDMLKKEPLPAVILLDLNMPGTDGLKLLEILKQDPKTASVPVIVFSNDETPKSHERAKSLGAAEYLEKIRVTPHEITEHIQKVLTH